MSLRRNWLQLICGCLGVCLLTVWSGFFNNIPGLPEWPVLVSQVRADESPSVASPRTTGPVRTSNSKPELLLSLAQEGDAPPATAAADPDAPKYRLAYKYAEGAVVRYESIQKSDIDSQYNDVTESASNTTETRKHYQVTKVLPDGTAEIELVIDWVRMKAKFGATDPGIEFDSAAPGANTQQKFKNIFNSIGKPQARLICDATGKVLKTEDLTITATNAIGVSQAVTLKNVSGENHAYSILTLLPADPVAVGTEWKDRFETKVTAEENRLITITLQRTYTLEKVENGVASIKFKTANITPIKDPRIRMQLVQQMTSGKIQFDIEQGAVLQRTVDTFDNVIGPFGANSKVKSQSHLFEKLMTAVATAENTDTKLE